MKKLLVWLMLLSCTGCSALPAEERAFAVALMVTKKGESWQVYGRIPTYQSDGSYRTVTGEGTQLLSALADMEAASPMPLHLSQLRLLVLDAALEGDAISVLQTVSERADMRLQCSVAMTEIPANVLMEALVPQTGTRLSKMLDVLLESRQEQGLVLPMTLADAIRMGERQTPVLMALTLQNDALDVSGGYALGMQNVPLTAQETVLLSLLWGTAKTPYLLLQDGGARVRDVHCRITLEGSSAATVEVTMQAVENSMPTDLLEAALAEELLALLTRLSQSGCDVLGLGQQAMCGVDTMNDWYALAWPERLKGIRWTVTVRVTGIT